MNNSNQADIFLLGRGALGQSLHFLLSNAGLHPSMHSRSYQGHVALKVQDNSGDCFHTMTVASFKHLCKKKKTKKPRLLFFCQKAQDTITSLEELAPYVTSDDTLILLSNGIGVYDSCLSFCSKTQLIRMAVHFGMLIQDEQLIFSGSPAFSIAKPDVTKERCHTIQHLFHDYPMKEFQSVQELEWNKASINYLVNSLCTLVRSRNSLILKEPLSLLASTLFDEFLTVARAEKIPLEHTCYSDVSHAIEHYKDNVNSSLQDIIHGRHTELDFIMGPVLDAARNHAIQVPLSSIVYTLLYALERAKL